MLVRSEVSFRDETSDRAKQYGGSWVLFVIRFDWGTRYDGPKVRHDQQAHPPFPLDKQYLATYDLASIRHITTDLRLDP